MTDNEVNRRLEARAVASHLLGIGRSGLIERWGRFVAEVEGGYRLGLDDYRNDLDLREVIEDVGLGDDAEIRVLDRRLADQLQHTERTIWQSGQPEAFWIRGYPRKVSETFLQELKGA